MASGRWVVPEGDGADRRRGDREQSGEEKAERDAGEDGGHGHGHEDRAERFERETRAGQNGELVVGDDQDRGAGEDRSARSGGIGRQEVFEGLRAAALAPIPDPCAQQRGEQPWPARGAGEQGREIGVWIAPGGDERRLAQDYAGSRDRQQIQGGTAQSSAGTASAASWVTQLLSSTCQPRT